MASDQSSGTAKTDDAPAFTLLAGECRIEVDADLPRTYRGQVVVLIKPDDTILVHDVEGYQPAAWLTRADRVVIDDEAGTVTAVEGDRWLRVDFVSRVLDRRIPGGVAGTPVGTCPACTGHLIDTGGAVHCVSCRARYGLPDGAELLDRRCDACDLPRMRIERGDRFELCIDRECEPMESVIADRFDGTWACPDAACSGTLRVLRRSDVLLACDAYPDCDVAFRVPTGVLDGHCGCGLPRFRDGKGSRCLDGTCQTTS